MPAIRHHVFLLNVAPTPVPVAPLQLARSRGESSVSFHHQRRVHVAANAGQIETTCRPTKCTKAKRRTRAFEERVAGEERPCVLARLSARPRRVQWHAELGAQGKGGLLPVSNH